MKELIKSIPNAFTLGNLLCGLLGIMCVFDNDLKSAFWFILLAGGFDFLDGFLARLLKVDGDMGKQLDSLADMVTFGVLPGLISWNLMESSGYCPKDSFCINRYVWLAFPLASAWRLARFNIDTRQTNGFLGVPTPIAGLTLASVALSVSFKTPMADLYTNFWVLKALPLALAMLMVSEIPMIAFKFKKSDKQNIWKYALLLTALIIGIVFKYDSMPIIFAAYVLFSIISNFVLNLKTNG